MHEPYNQLKPIQNTAPGIRGFKAYGNSTGLISLDNEGDKGLL